MNPHSTPTYSYASPSTPPLLTIPNNFALEHDFAVKRPQTEQYLQPPPSILSAAIGRQLQNYGMPTSDGVTDGMVQELAIRRPIHL